MEKRAFKLSLEKAKNWYNGSSQDLKRIALEVYSEEELTKVELPNSWKECEKYLCYTKVLYNILNTEDVPIRYKALIKLEILRDCYRQGWKPDCNDGSTKNCIEQYGGKIYTCTYSFVNRFLSFQSPEIRDKFFENFKYLIEEAGDLI